jgi:hypothetical protein
MYPLMLREIDLQSLVVDKENKFNWDRALEAANFFAHKIDIPEARDRDVSNWEILASFVCLAIDLKGKEFEYNTIVSDDGGGRIVSIFIKYLLSIKRRELESNAPSPIVYFVSPHEPDLVNGFIDNIHDSLGKVLVVTELIRNGKGTRVFGDALNRYNDVSFDVASISSVKLGVPEQLESEYNTKVFVGESLGWGAGEVFHKQPFNAVGAILIEGKPHLKRNDKFDSPVVVAARRNIFVLAEEIAKLI